MILKACRFALIGMYLLPVAAKAESPPLDQLQWLAGVWHAKLPDGVIESTYYPELGNEMIGTLRQIVDGKTTRYEMRNIRIQDDEVIYQILPFGPAMQPLPPIAVKTLISANDTDIAFTGVQLHRIRDDEMIATLALRQPDGSFKTAKIDFVRIEKLIK